MKTYRYFGNSTCDAGEIVLKKFGQTVQLSDEKARDILGGGGGIITADQFALVDFTPSQISDKRERNGENENYMAKHRQALTFMRELKEELNNTSVAAPQASGVDDNV